MNQSRSLFSELKSNRWIDIVSIVVLIVVIVLLSMQNKFYFGEWTRSIPHAIGIINTLTTISLIAGLIFIKQGKINLHRNAMLFSFLLGTLFLVLYVTYHLSNRPMYFSGQGFIRYLYFFILISHVALSVVVLPLVLRALLFALTDDIIRHKKIVKFAYPIWLYVSITGVLVYLFNNVLYQSNR